MKYYWHLVGLLAVVFVAVVLFELRAYFFIISIGLAMFGSVYGLIFACTKLSDHVAESYNHWNKAIAENRKTRYLRFSQDEIIATFDKSGLKMVYIPPAIERQRIVDSSVELVPQPLAIDSSKKAMPSIADLIIENRIGTDDMLLGHDAEMQEIRACWKTLKAILILGLQGGGKTNTAIWLMVQVLLQGGKIVLIDKHARSEEDSMYQKVRPFEKLFDCSVGDTPQSALRALNHVRSVFDARLDGEVCAYPLLLIVDEFSAIMRQRNTDEKWSKAAIMMSALIEDLNMEGRKHKVFAVCIGQIANASRSGGTEIRDTFNTRIVHRMREKQAGILSLAEQKAMIGNLRTGQAIFDIEDHDEPFMVQIPLVSDTNIAAIARQLGCVQDPFNGRSRPIQDDVDTMKDIDTENLVNELVEPSEREIKNVQRVLELRKIGIGKAAIIKEVWGLTKGGGGKYKSAEVKYERIVKRTQPN